MSEEEPAASGHVEPYGGTNVQVQRLPQSDRIMMLEHAIEDADKYLTKYTMLRAAFVDELNEILNG